jgi:hypothetical protein
VPCRRVKGPEARREAKGGKEEEWETAWAQEIYKGGWIFWDVHWVTKRGLTTGRDPFLACALRPLACFGPDKNKATTLIQNILRSFFRTRFDLLTVLH